MWSTTGKKRSHSWSDWCWGVDCGTVPGVWWKCICTHKLNVSGFKCTKEWGGRDGHCLGAFELQCRTERKRDSGYLSQLLVLSQKSIMLLNPFWYPCNTMTFENIVTKSENAQKPYLPACMTCILYIYIDKNNLFLQKYWFIWK